MGIGEEPVIGQGAQHMAVVDAGAILGFSSRGDVAGAVVDKTLRGPLHAQTPPPVSLRYSS